MSEHHERRSAAPSLVHDRVLTDRPGKAEAGAQSTLRLEQAAPAARGQWIAVVLRGGFSASAMLVWETGRNGC